MKGQLIVKTLTRVFGGIIGEIDWASQEKKKDYVINNLNLRWILTRKLLFSCNDDLSSPFSSFWLRGENTVSLNKDPSLDRVREALPHSTPEKFWAPDDDVKTKS